MQETLLIFGLLALGACTLLHLWHWVGELQSRVRALEVHNHWLRDGLDARKKS